MKEAILSQLPHGFPWADRIIWFDSIGSTNDEAKKLAAQGAPHGTTLIAGHQTGGRGRLGRNFQSPAGKGIYLSLILRPNCPPQNLMHLTCAAAAAMCDAIEDAAGFRPGIKWTNDLVFNRKKLGGILTELSVDHNTGLIRYVVIGIGINCTQKPEDFSPELQDMATSVSAATGRSILPCSLAASMLCRLRSMSEALLTGQNSILAAYRRDCVTLGQEISLVRGEERQYGTALDIDDEGGLLVRFQDGSIKTVTSGEVSVRGMYGYL